MVTNIHYLKKKRKKTILSLHCIAAILTGAVCQTDKCNQKDYHTAFSVVTKPSNSK